MHIREMQRHPEYHLTAERYPPEMCPGVSDVERLLEQVHGICDRVDRFIADNHSSPRPTPTSMPQVYLATSPSGHYHGLIMQPEAMTRAPPTIQWSNLHQMAAVGGHNVASMTAQPNFAPAGAQPNEAGVVQNVVRQAVINQQRRQNEPANAGAFARHVRRIWLFVRLYFFIYMISEPGTWTRVIFVALAALTALLSDSQLPQQLYGMLIAPIQRHLEGLAHAGGPAEQPARATAEDNTNNQRAAPRNVTNEIWDYLWRAERSIVLLLASLIPGVGERQVQARNAAEAERVRQEEERERERQQEHEQAQTQEQTQEQT